MGKKSIIGKIDLPSTSTQILSIIIDILDLNVPDCVRCVWYVTYVMCHTGIHEDDTDQSVNVSVI